MTTITSASQERKWLVMCGGVFIDEDGELTTLKCRAKLFDSEEVIYAAASAAYSTGLPVETIPSDFDERSTEDEDKS